MKRRYAGVLCLAVSLVSSTGFSQLVLSDFEAGVDGWSGTLAGTVPFPNGTTLVSQVDEAGNGVLRLLDAGFGAGAVRVYPGASLGAGYFLFSADIRIETDSGFLDTPASLAVGFGSTIATEQELSYSTGVGTTASDTGQGFTTYYAALRSGGAGDVVVAFTPDRVDWAVSSGTWDVRIDNVTRWFPNLGAPTVLDDFEDTLAAEWAPIDALNSPFPAGTSTVANVDAGGDRVLQITDGGFGGGAVGVFPSAISGAGFYTILVSVRVITDPGNLVTARIAASAGATTNPRNLAWSRSFTTAGDDSGSAFITLPVPIVSTGISDAAIYVLPDFDAAVAAGSWVIQIDDVTLLPPVLDVVDWALYE